MASTSAKPASKRRPPAAPARARATYERDYYSWALQQAELLRSGRAAEADHENIAEELTDLGREQFHKLESAYRVLLVHLLKWDFQEEKRTRSWAITVAIQRNHARRVLEDNPGLKSRINEARGRAYRDARLEAAAETGLKIATFPAECPYTLDAMMTRDIPVD
jgi:hypothetical protein